MANLRISHWIEAGAGIGILLALLALTDARRILPYAWHVSDRVDFSICYWLILGFAP
jgi:hypothetical protein